MLYFLFFISYTPVENYFNYFVIDFLILFCFFWYLCYNFFFCKFSSSIKNIQKLFFIFFLQDNFSDFNNLIVSPFFFNFFENILGISLGGIWCSLLFDANWTTVLLTNYRLSFFQYPGLFSLNLEFFFLFLKFLPYAIDAYLITLVAILSIYSCLGKWVLFSEIRVYWTVVNSIKTVTLFYAQILIFQYFLFCYDLKLGPLFFFIKSDVHFGQLDSWVILLRFFTGIFFLIFFYLLGDFVKFSGYLWSFEALIFFLIAFEMLYVSVSTHNLLVLLGSIAGISIATYILIAFERTYSSLEAAIKYFCLSAVATGIMSFGYILIYHISSGSQFCFYSPSFYAPTIYESSYIFKGIIPTFSSLPQILGFSTSFESIFLSSLPTNNFLNVNSSEFSYLYLYQCGFAFFLVGFFFKLSLFPCYIWAPDVYEGSPTPVVAFMVISVKFVIFLVLLRVVFIFSYFDTFFWLLFKIVGLCSIVIGSVGALVQQKIKRFLAYTSINQIGLMLLGLSFDPLNMLGSLFALFVYITTNLLFFGILLTTREIRSQRLLLYMSDLHNLFISSPKNVIYLSVSVLSMSGIPPFAGFFSKYFLILPIINSEFGFFFGLTILIFHIIGTFNYLRLLRNLWFYDFSKILPFFSSLSLKNNFWFQILAIFQFICIFGLDFVFLFCNYWRWSLSSVNWC